MDWLEELESLVRRGQFDEVERRLRKLNFKKISRQDSYLVANIARRINRPDLTMRILNPILRSQGPVRSPPTSLEKLEYAASLRRLGGIDEAWELLGEIDADEFPETLMFQALCLFTQWKYKEALPLLARYVSVESLFPYARCVGEMNLAAAFLHEERYEEAEELLRGLRDETRQSEFLLLYGNALELSAQLSIQQKNWDQARNFLDEASSVLQRTGQVEALWVKKWEAVAESLKENRVSASLQELFFSAQAARHWETYRDCEFYIASLEKDWDRLRHVYFGTPYESYRIRIRHFAGSEFEVPESYIWSAGLDPGIVLDLASGEVHGKKATGRLPFGHTIHQFLILASRDFYRPLPVLTAFGKIFPDEFLNVDTSANRVHQIVQRLRRWIESESLQIEIEERDGAYRLRPGSGTGLRVPATPLSLDPHELEWNLLKGKVRRGDFSIHEACTALSSSKSSMLRLLRWALSEGKVLKVGKGTQTQYRVVT